jgi:hypothetical protein
MAMLRFSRVMLIRDANPYVPITAAQAQRLQPGWRRPMPVLVRIDGKPAKAWRINLMPAGDGSFYLYLHGTVRKASGTGVGDRVQVEVAFDPEYKGGPMHPMPRWFSTALAKDPKAKAGWLKLPPSRKKEILRYLSGLKSKEARGRNVAKAMHVLSGRPGRYMARDWQDGA